METIESNAALASEEREHSINQLTQIDGIARKTAEAMYAEGIHECKELAEYLRQHTAEEVSEMLKEHGLNRPAGFIKLDAWIRQAEFFTQPEKAAPSMSQADQTPTKATQKTPSSPNFKDHDYVFFVFFDIVISKNGEPLLFTTVYDNQNGGSEKEFKDQEVSTWVNWMLERAGQPPAIKQVEAAGEPQKETPHAETETAAPVVLEEPYKAQIEIGEIEISQVRSSPKDSGKKLKAEITFHLSGADAEALASLSLPYRAEIYSIDFDKGAPRFVTDSDGKLVPNLFDYTHQLEFIMPPAGRYELHSLIRLPPTGELKGYYQGPIIRITP